MGITNIIKKSILEGFYLDLSIIDIIVTFGMAVTAGIFIYVIYRFKTKTQFYSVDFNNSLLVLPIITSGIVLAIQSNIVISLGMVGALSIVRFRNAVKNTIDLMFLFWSISLGIIIGAHLYSVAFILSFITALTLLIVDLIPLKKTPYLLILNAEKIQEDKKLLDVLKKFTNSYLIKSKSIAGINTDYIIEIRCKDSEQLLKELQKIKTLKNISLLQHDGTLRV